MASMALTSNAVVRILHTLLDNQALRLSPSPSPGLTPENCWSRHYVETYVLRVCAEELKDVLTDIFNTALSQAVVPTCYKATPIISFPNKLSPSVFIDYCPVAQHGIHHHEVF